MHNRNTLRVNQETMKKMVEHYANTVMFQKGQEIKVTNVQRQDIGS